MRVPSLLIPFPQAASNHQFSNAFAFESTGAAVLIEQDDVKPENLLAALRPMVEDHAVRQRMQTALEAWHQPEAAALIADRLLGQKAASVAGNPCAGGDTAVLPRKKALVA
jgi:UDP-N-acetylglucosamine--N-acetylmuramyl-(pentapeptide) pyrophosphoryl-undecaprenol N-acetylglucosamine transferase